MHPVCIHCTLRRDLGMSSLSNHFSSSCGYPNVMLQVMTNFNERKDKVDIDLSTNIVESKRSEHTVVLSLKFLFSKRSEAD